MVLLLILQSLWFVFPAYAANAAPVLIKGSRPLDFRTHLGKNRLLGDGKTFEGAAGGIIVGIVAGLIQNALIPSLPAGLGLARFSMQLLLLLAAGAIIGDIIGAFIKRRLGIPRGYPAPLLDQLDFLVGALLAASAVVGVGKSMAIALLVLTPIIHAATNRISFWLKMKKVPW